MFLYFGRDTIRKKNMQLISLEEKSLVCLHCNHTPVSQKYEPIDGERGGV